MFIHQLRLSVKRTRVWHFHNSLCKKAFQYNFQTSYSYYDILITYIYLLYYNSTCWLFFFRNCSRVGRCLFGDGTYAVVQSLYGRSSMPGVGYAHKKKTRDSYAQSAEPTVCGKCNMRQLNESSLVSALGTELFERGFGWSEKKKKRRNWEKKLTHLEQSRRTHRCWDGKSARAITHDRYAAREFSQA